MNADKSSHLMQYVDLDRPSLAVVKAAADPAIAFLDYIARPPRPRFRVEYERKAEMLDFLSRHYAAWRNFDLTEAKRLAGMTIEQARATRALSTAPVLGQAWWATGDPAWGRAFERFYLAVPTGEMFNWDYFNGTQGAIELDAFFLLLDCEGFSPAGRIAFLDHLHALADNAWDVHTSSWQPIWLGPEGHNWFLHGMHVLPFIGLLFPEFKRAAFLARTGMSVVEEHVRGHYKADGGARETSPGYQVLSILNLWDFYLIAHRNGYPLSTGFADRILNATNFLLRMASPVGGVPSFGDGGHSPGGLTSLAAVAAALTGDGECKAYAERFRRHLAGAKEETPGEIPLCAFWSVGLAGAATYAETRERNPNSVSVLMGPTGYAALRSGGSPAAAYMAIAAADRGPIVTSHGHNEVFSLDVHAGGIRFIGEMGCVTYGESPGRVYDQKTEAHTCLAVDGMEQAPIVNEWRWRGHVIPAVRRWISEDTHDFFHGLHEGYYRYPEHLTLHARKVLFVKSAPCYWLVFDWIESNVANPLTAYFHGCCAGKAEGGLILLGKEGRTRLAICPPADDGLRAEKVWNDGLAAYIREKGLNADEYPCFAYRKRTTLDCLVWALVPIEPGDTPPAVKRLPVTLNGAAASAHRATAVEVAFPGHVDRACVSHTEFDAALAFGPEEAWGNIAFRRVAPGGPAVLSFDHRVADGVCGR